MPERLEKQRGVDPTADIISSLYVCDPDIETHEQEAKKWTQERLDKLMADIKDVSGHLPSDEEVVNTIGKLLVILEDNKGNFPKGSDQVASSSKGFTGKRSLWDRLFGFNAKEFEATHTLGAFEDGQASDVSTTKWQVFHQKNPSIKYPEIGHVKNHSFTNDGFRWQFDKNGAEIPVGAEYKYKEEQDSFISVSKYVDSNGKPRVRFGIVMSVDDPHDKTKKRLEVIDTRIKRDEPSETIETDIVAFRNVETGYTRYLKMKISGHQNAITTTRMKPEQVTQSATSQ